MSRVNMSAHVGDRCLKIKRAFWRPGTPPGSVAFPPLLLGSDLSPLKQVIKEKKADEAKWKRCRVTVNGGSFLFPRLEKDEDVRG